MQVLGFAPSRRGMALGARMSALGQKQTSRHLQPMSPLLSKADIANYFKALAEIVTGDDLPAPANVSAITHVRREMARPVCKVPMLGRSY